MSMTVLTVSRESPGRFLDPVLPDDLIAKQISNC